MRKLTFCYRFRRSAAGSPSRMCPACKKLLSYSRNKYICAKHGVVSKPKICKCRACSKRLETLKNSNRKTRIWNTKGHSKERPNIKQYLAHKRQYKEMRDNDGLPRHICPKCNHNAPCSEPFKTRPNCGEVLYTKDPYAHCPINADPSGRHAACGGFWPSNPYTEALELQEHIKTFHSESSTQSTGVAPHIAVAMPRMDEHKCRYIKHTCESCKSEWETQDRLLSGYGDSDNCVLPDTLILGDNKPISEYHEGSFALTQTGLNEVLGTTSNPHDGPMVTIKATGCLPMTLTPNHPLLVTTSISKHKKIIGFSPPQWKRADKVVPKKASKHTTYDGDYLMIPRYRGQFAPRTISLSPFIKGSAWNVKITELPLDEDIAWMLGLYVAEGSNGVESDGMIHFALNATELSIAKRLCMIIKRLGYSPRIRPCGNSKGIVVIFNSCVLFRAFHEWFGRGARNKQIPEWILLHKNRKIVESFLKGYEQGDGSHLPDGRYASSTVSKILALQLQLLVARLGDMYKISVAVKNNAKLPNGRICRHLTTNYYLHRLDHAPHKTQYHVMQDYILVPIEKVTMPYYKGDVMNVCSADATFLVSNIVTHNTWLGTSSIAENVSNEEFVKRQIRYYHLSGHYKDLHNHEEGTA